MYQQAEAFAIKGECLLLDFTTERGHWPLLPLTLGWSYTLSCLWSSACHLQILHLSAFTIVGGPVPHTESPCVSLYVSVYIDTAVAEGLGSFNCKYIQLPERQREA